MRQIIQYQKTGKLTIEDLPAPMVRPGYLLVRNVFSLISAGTERTSVTTAQASMVGKAKARPDLVKQVLANVQREGLMATVRKVQNRLDNFKELGYSSAGVVIESGVEEFRAGDRVACGGAGFASHAEVVLVPKNLAVRLPEKVSLEAGAFVTLGAIALQGVRQADIRIGETVAVIGLGLLGLISVQLLKASGCRVVGIDVSRANFAVARSIGCDDCMLMGKDAARKVHSITRGYGTDAVIITAGTSSNEPVELALQIARRRSTVVVVGAVRMDIPRSPFYEKELEFRISCSYGPGRYDPAYELHGMDYPLGYVRWTERRNMEGVVDLLASEDLDVAPLITHRIPIDRGLEAYDLITGKTKGRYLGILVHYPGEVPPAGKLVRYKAAGIPPPAERPAGRTVFGVIGAGNFAQAYLLPPIKDLGAGLRGVTTTRSVNAGAVMTKFGFEYCSTDPIKVLEDAGLDAVLIATRHDSHALYVTAALKHGKHVFVEKPLATTDDQLAEVQRAYRASTKNRRLHLTVGFNRRYSRPVKAILEFFAERREPLVMVYRVNAGVLPPEHWVHDPAQGGRIIGEGCHFIDTMSAAAGAPVVSVSASALDGSTGHQGLAENVLITATFGDGSVGTLVYHANGAPGLGKEYLEVHGGGRTAILEDFRTVTLYDQRSTKRLKFDGTKGHSEEVREFLDVLAGKVEPTLTVESILNTTTTTFRALEALRTRTTLTVL
jgi:predicted dehydrogenase/threonine dehydrogenase-like Zn-dependent dehydrogenase